MKLHLGRQVRRGAGLSVVAIAGGLTACGGAAGHNKVALGAAPPCGGPRGAAPRAALAAGLGGRPAVLEDLLSRLGRADGPRPTLRLAAAFGAELAAVAVEPRAVVRLLSHLGANDAAPEEAA